MRRRAVNDDSGRFGPLAPVPELPRDVHAAKINWSLSAIEIVALPGVPTE